ncbi:MAG: hypothetical protein ACRC6M_07360, partial [Microcystaceae cyanobacterium]
MKIGIVTFHTAVNPGAFLQAFALTKVLEKLGYEAEIINFLQSNFLYKEFSSCLHRNKGIKRIS